MKVVIKTIAGKLSNKIGESLAETLVSTLIAALAMLIMAGALVASSKSIRSGSNISSFASSETTDSGQSVKFTSNDGSKSYTVDLHSKETESENDIRKVYYYEKSKNTSN